MVSLTINVLNIKTWEWVPYNSALKCYYLQQSNNNLSEYHPASLKEGYCAIRGGAISEYAAIRIQWHGSYYRMASRTSETFVKPGQKKASDYALCIHNPDNEFREFKNESHTELSGNVFRIRWDVAGKGDSWVSRSTTSEGYVRMRDTESDYARGMLITGGAAWLPDIETIPRIALDSKSGKARPIEDNLRVSFDLCQTQTVNTNYRLEEVLKLKSPADAACIVNTNNRETATIIRLKGAFGNPEIGYDVRHVDLEAKAKPCGAYLHFVESQTLVGDTEHTLKKIKGYTRRFTVSVEVKASVSAGILALDASLEVTTGFAYEEEIKTEVEETWTTRIPAGRYIVFQPVLVYAYRLNPTPAEREAIQRVEENGRFFPVGEELYFFASIYRNDPFTIRYDEEQYEPVQYDHFIDYLMTDGYPRWN